MAKEKNKNDFVVEVMNTSLFSIEEKLKIINKMRTNNLSDKEIRDILNWIKKFDKWFSEIKNQYYSNMDKVYAQYLDKNIPVIKQWVAKMELEVKEIKTDEKEWNPDLLLNQIN